MSQKNRMIAAKLRKFYLWCFVLSMPFIAFAYCYIMYGARLGSEWKPWLFGYIIVYALGYVSWRLHYSYDFYLQNRFPGIDQTSKRISWKFLINIMIMSPSVVIILFVFSYFHIEGYNIMTGDVTKMLMVGFAVNIIFESLYEAVYIIEKYK